MKIALLEEEMETTKLIADFEKRVVTTVCGDTYMDYDINFDDFIIFAKLINEQDKYLNCMSKTKD